MTKVLFSIPQVKFLSFGLLATILFVTTWVSIEPVNNPKLMILSSLGATSWMLVFQNRISVLRNKLGLLLPVVVVFSIFAVLSTLTSSIPFEQNFYGVFGRSTGLLTYLSLSGLVLVSALYSKKSHFQYQINAIQFAGFFNVLYCSIVLMGFDVFGWNNLYGEILGTLGNPNFISAFLGIFSATVFPYIVSNENSIRYRIILLVSVLLSLFEIQRSLAIQGLMVFLIGGSISLFYFIRHKFKSWVPSAAFSLFIISGFGVAALGMLQRGPLAQYLYKSSVSFRGVYWDAGISIGNKHPFTGVGFDSYGDYFREVRSAQAMIAPGPTTVTNSAHNVFIDIFASGGYPLLVSYLSIVLLVLIAIYKQSRKSKQFDPLFVALTAGAVGYLAQSIVSINQIGLAICGWVLFGCVIGYERLDRIEITGSNSAVKESSGKPGNGSISLAVAGIIGFIIAVPPFIVDAQWKSALNRGDGNALIELADKWPRDVYRMTNIVFTLEKNNFSEEAVLLARKTVEFNPRSYDAWKILVQISKSSPEEKIKGVEMMHKLDPRNTKLL